MCVCASAKIHSSATGGGSHPPGEPKHPSSGNERGLSGQPHAACWIFNQTDHFSLSLDWRNGGSAEGSSLEVAAPPRICGPGRLTTWHVWRLRPRSNCNSTCWWKVESTFGELSPRQTKRSFYSVRIGLGHPGMKRSWKNEGANHTDALLHRRVYWCKLLLRYFTYPAGVRAVTPSPS